MIIEPIDWTAVALGFNGVLDLELTDAERRALADILMETS